VSNAGRGTVTTFRAFDDSRNGTVRVGANAGRGQSPRFAPSMTHEMAQFGWARNVVTVPLSTVPLSTEEVP
jgi:hypothetical protein